MNRRLSSIAAAALFVSAVAGSAPLARAEDRPKQPKAESPQQPKAESPKPPKTESPKESKMSQPTDEQRNYHFTFRSQMDSVGPDLFAYMQVLRIHGATGHAVMLLNRHGGDRIRLPVGLFGTTLTKQQVAGPADAVDGLKWAELPAAKGGDINAAILSIDFSRGTKIIQRSLNARNTELLQALAPVMTQVSDLGRTLQEHPLRAVEASVAKTPTGFRLTLRNVGTGPVLLADPRLVLPGATQPRATIRVASSPPGTDFTYLLWESVPLEPLGAAPASVTVDPGKTLDVDTVAWTPKAGGDHYVQGAWQDYVGPHLDPKTVMDAIPDPDKMNDPRPYVIRGAAFSAYVKFAAEKPRR